MRALVGGMKGRDSGGRDELDQRAVPPFSHGCTGLPCWPGPCELVAGNATRTRRQRTGIRRTRNGDADRSHAPGWLRIGSVLPARVAPTLDRAGLPPLPYHF